MTPAGPGGQPLTILWRDEHLIAIHKPAGWLVHRTGLDAAETRFVVQTLRGQLGGQHVYPVHRLDKGTCGVLLLALYPEAARAMGELLARHAVHKRYLALVRGWVPLLTEIDHPLRPDDSPPDTPAQPAHTRLQRLARLDWPEPAAGADPRFASTRVSLVLAEPTTGRRHQIRRHLKHIAHPIIGDATHGKGPLNRWWADRLGRQRLWLHAWGLAFRHPLTGEDIAVNSGLCLAPQGLDAPGDPIVDLQHWCRLSRLAGWASG
jgi:tRNA pseudouridine65 synthase